MSISDIIRAKEDTIRAYRAEWVFAIDDRGKVILDRGNGEDRLTIEDDEVARLRDSYGVVLTHNHPTGWHFPAEHPHRDGLSFSWQDIQLACTAELEVVRVVTPRYRYSMSPAHEGWDEDYWTLNLRPAYEQAYERRMIVLLNAVHEGRIERGRFWPLLFHEVWEEVAGRLGLRYTRQED